ncbi:uncharacterized protein LOC127716314 [Mytilus californianus]|uniref:uncharacterized protein LOC127716314 n=1 Tax=Mytilus californianus TaxID=6549 RepID=UPI0022452D45|nr:uncharacterized protein LOC127716314 [Mytilus californianus]
MNCIAALFSWTANYCVLYKDRVSGEFENKNELLISNVTEKTKFYLSSWKRIFFEIIETGSTNPLLNDNSFKCFVNSSETTTELVQTTTTTTTSVCTCTLNDCRSFKNSTEILEMIEDIKKNLYIDKQQLSSTKRKLQSAEDPRTSSKSIGLFGVAILTSVLLTIVLADVPRLLSFIKNASINKINDHLEP